MTTYLPLEVITAIGMYVTLTKTYARNVGLHKLDVLINKQKASFYFQKGIFLILLLTVFCVVILRIIRTGKLTKKIHSSF